MRSLTSGAPCPYRHGGPWLASASWGPSEEASASSFGLPVYAPTAPVAMIGLGIPAAVLGAFSGLALGLRGWCAAESAVGAADMRPVSGVLGSPTFRKRWDDPAFDGEPAPMGSRSTGGSWHTDCRFEGSGFSRSSDELMLKCAPVLAVPDRSSNAGYATLIGGAC